MMAYRIHRNHHGIIFFIGFLNVFQAFGIAGHSIEIHVKTGVQCLIVARHPGVFFRGATADKQYQKKQKNAMFGNVFQTNGAVNYC